jgi:hypothetical protein
MTDVMSSKNQGVTGLSAADEQLLKELTERARADGLKLTGQDSLLGKLTKMVIEGALEGEMDDHLGYARHDPNTMSLSGFSSLWWRDLAFCVGLEARRDSW